MDFTFIFQYEQLVHDIQSAKVAVNMEDPLIKDYGRPYYEHILTVMYQADQHGHHEEVQKALQEIKLLLRTSYEMDRVQIPQTQQQQQQQVLLEFAIYYDMISEFK